MFKIYILINSIEVFIAYNSLSPRQIRLTSGTQLTQTFDIGEPLSAVRLYALQHMKTSASVPLASMANITFVLTFPRKVYAEYEMQKSLSILSWYSLRKRVQHAFISHS